MNLNCCNDIYDILSFVINDRSLINFSNINEPTFIDFAVKKAKRGNTKLLKIMKSDFQKNISNGEPGVFSNHSILRSMLKHLTTKQIIKILPDCIHLFRNYKTLKYILESNIAYPHPPPAGFSLEEKNKMREVLREYFNDDDPNYDLGKYNTNNTSFIVKIKL